jgi:hypothetical protein
MDGIVQSNGPSNSNASDHCAMPDHYSNGRGSDTDNGVRGNSNSSVRPVVGRSLADWLQRRPLAGRRQWSAGWLDIATSWLVSPGANSDALVDRIYHLRRRCVLTGPAWRVRLQSPPCGSPSLAVSVRAFRSSNPAWRIVFDPGSGRLYASKSVKLLLRPFRPGHKNEIAPIFRLANFEGRTVFQRDHIATLPIA